MEEHQSTQREVQEDINARLALISQAVAAKLLSRQPAVLEEGKTSEQEQNTLTMSTCPIDPMERLLCESCQ